MKVKEIKKLGMAPSQVSRRSLQQAGHMFQSLKHSNPTDISLIHILNINVSILYMSHSDVTGNLLPDFFMSGILVLTRLRSMTETLR